MSYSDDAVIMTESGRIQEFEELLERYNRAFYDRDLAALRALYVPDVEVPYFDNHTDCDSTDLESHLDKVATFFETGDIVPLLVENVRALRLWRCRVRGRHGPLLDGTGTWSSGIVLLGASCDGMEDSPYPLLAGSK